MKFAVIINKERILSVHESYDDAERALVKLQRDTKRNEGPEHFLPLIIGQEAPGESIGSVGGLCHC